MHEGEGEVWPDDDARRWLHARARECLRAALRHEAPPPATAPTDPRSVEALARAWPLFVSWHRGEALVGCIGTLVAQLPLAEAVEHFAVQAGAHDRRTPNPDPEEVDRLELEITLLGEFEALCDASGARVERPTEIAAALQPGAQGLELADAAGRRAFFLPSVWTQLPRPQDFVDALARKGGLDLEATPWRARICRGISLPDPARPDPARA